MTLALGQRQDEAGEAARAGEAITAARLRDQWERHFADDKRGSRAAATAQVRCWNWRGALCIACLTALAVRDVLCPGKIASALLQAGRFIMRSGGCDWPSTASVFVVAARGSRGDSPARHFQAQSSDVKSCC